MLTESYITRLEEEGIEIPTTVDEVLSLKGQIQIDLIAEYSCTSINESHDMMPSARYEFVRQRRLLLSQYNNDNSELDTLMTSIQNKECEACYEAVQGEWMDELMKEEAYRD